MEKIYRYAIYSDESKGKAIRFCESEEEAVQLMNAWNNAQAFGFADERVNYYYKEINLYDEQLRFISEILQHTHLFKPYIENEDTAVKKAKEIVHIIQN